MPAAQRNLKMSETKRSALSYRVKALSFAEDQSYTPNSRKSNYCIDNSADNGHRSAADPSNDVKIEYAYATPVESADNSENKSYSIYYHHGLSPRLSLGARQLVEQPIVNLNVARAKSFCPSHASLPDFSGLLIFWRKKRHI